MFQDAIFCDEQTGQLSLEGTYVVEEGDFLTLYVQDGSVLWEGEVLHRPAGLLALWCAKLRGRAATVPPELWKAWFDHTPPLKARITMHSGSFRRPLGQTTEGPDPDLGSA